MFLQRPSIMRIRYSSLLAIMKLSAFLFVCTCTCTYTATAQDGCNTLSSTNGLIIGQDKTGVLGRHGSVSLCRVERENKMAATYNVLAFKR